MIGGATDLVHRIVDQSGVSRSGLLVGALVFAAYMIGCIVGRRTQS